MSKDSGKKCACGSGNETCCGGHSKSWIFLGVAVVIALIAVKETIRHRTAGSPIRDPAAGEQGAAVQTNRLPRLVDLGAGKCIPCKMMAPILEDLKKTHAGKMDVQFIDVWENPDAGKQYGISVIPTQIFYDAAGKELFRHEGFYGKEDILAKWKELGVAVEPAAHD